MLICDQTRACRHILGHSCSNEGPKELAFTFPATRFQVYECRPVEGQDAGDLELGLPGMVQGWSDIDSQSSVGDAVAAAGGSRSRKERRVQCHFSPCETVSFVKV